MNPSLVTISRWLSFILRHQPEAIGLELDAGGWAIVEDLICLGQQQGVAIDRDLLTTVVETNSKQRFAFNADRSKIRANQGHSRPVDLGLVPQTPPPILFHGTAESALASIQQQGILPGSRQFVHLSSDVTTARQVGSRHGKPIVLRIDAQGLAAKGVPFLISENGVWLVDQVPIGYFTIAE